MSKQFLGHDYSNNQQVKIFFYLLVGGTAALIEWSCFYVLESKLALNYLVSAALAFTVSTTYHYFLTNLLVFESGARYSRGKEISLVFLVSVIGLLWNLLLMRIFVGAWQWNPMVAKVTASCLVVVWNYISRKKWIY